jgi:hypothetical protein
VSSAQRDVVARGLTRRERDAFYPQIVAVATGFGEYPTMTRRVIRLFEVAPI